MRNMCKRRRDVASGTTLRDRSVIRGIRERGGAAYRASREVLNERIVRNEAGRQQGVLTGTGAIDVQVDWVLLAGHGNSTSLS